MLCSKGQVIGMRHQKVLNEHLRTEIFIVKHREDHTKTLDDSLLHILILSGFMGYIGNLEAADCLVQFRDASEQLDGGVHVAGVTDIDESKSLRDLEWLLDVHCSLSLDLSRLLELLAGLGSHYYQGASLGESQQGFVVLS